MSDRPMPCVEHPAAGRRAAPRRLAAMGVATTLAAAIMGPVPAGEPPGTGAGDPVAARIADLVASRATKPSVHEDRAGVERALAVAGVPPATIARLFTAVARADLPGMAASLDAFLFLARDPEWLAVRRHFAEFLELPGVAALDAARVRPLVAYGGVVTLPDVVTLTPATAAALVPFGDSDWGAAVEFPAVRSLAPEAAEAIVGCHALLVFPALENLSPAAARALARHEGIGIVIGGLASLPADVAAALAETRSARGLLLPDLERLESKPLAARLARQDHVFLPRVRAIDADVAASLGENDGGELALPGLEALPADVARQIVGAGYYWLRLAGGPGLSPEAAAVLAGHVGQLTFTGPVPFSAAAAAELAKHEGVLSLPHVTALPADVARALAPHRGSLVLGGLHELSAEAAGLLAGHAGDVHLPGLESLTPEVAAVLAARSSPIVLSGLRSLDPTTAAALASFRGMLALPALESLTPDVARALAAHRGVLVLDSVGELRGDVAAELARHDGGLALDGIDSLSTQAAVALASAPDVLSLCGLAAVTPDGAAALARRPGPLVLGALADLDRIDSIPVAELLVARFEDLALANVTALDGPEAAAIARVLARTRGSLALPSLERITPRALAALLAKPGVQLPDVQGLQLLPDAGAGGGDDVVIPQP